MGAKHPFSWQGLVVAMGGLKILLLCVFTCLAVSEGLEQVLTHFPQPYRKSGHQGICQKFQGHKKTSSRYQKTTGKKESTVEIVKIKNSEALKYILGRQCEMHV